MFVDNMIKNGYFFVMKSEKKKFSEKYIDEMIKREMILPTQREQYQYGLQITFLKLVNFAISILVILFLPYRLGSGVFLLFLFWLRGQTGGFHASSPFKCTLCSCILLIVCSYGAIYLNQITNFWIWSFLLVSSIIIVNYTPVNSLELDLTEYEEALCKMRAKRILIYEIIVIVLTGIGNNTRLIASYGSFAIIVCAVAMIVGRWQTNVK